MESFHIDSELGQESLPKKYFYGNMRVYNSGRSVFNRKAIGIYITLTISLSSAALLSFLVFKLEIFQTLGNVIFSLILFPHTCFIVAHTVYVSSSNPGFFKPEERDLSKDDKIKTLVASVGDHMHFLKYCSTCKIVRELRVFHCKDCNLCVLRHDHHCPWLSICIGSHNHKIFLRLLFFSLIQCSILISYSGYLIYLFHNLEGALTRNVYYYLTISLISFTCLITILLLLVIFFQIKFICINQTTSENIRSHSNMFNIGCSGNIKEFFQDNLAYRNRITYTPSALAYLSNFKIISEQISFDLRRSNSSKSTNKKNSVKEIEKSFEVEEKQKEKEKEIRLDSSSLSSNCLNKMNSSLITQEK